jgi:hypothetical protein
MGANDEPPFLEGNGGAGICCFGVGLARLIRGEAFSVFLS